MPEDMNNNVKAELNGMQDTKPDQVPDDNSLEDAISPSKEEKQENQKQISTPEENREMRPEGRTNIDFLLDVPLGVSVELGRAKIAVRDMLQLGPGAVLELDKMIGEPLDLLVNDKLIARGEVVVFDDNFGIRITDIIKPEDRIRSLR